MGLMCFHRQNLRVYRLWAASVGVVFVVSVFLGGSPGMAQETTGTPFTVTTTPMLTPNRAETINVSVTELPQPYQETNNQEQVAVTGSNTGNPLQDFLFGFLSELAAGALIAVVAYILIDRRLRQHQEKRAYTAIYFVLAEVIAHLQHLIDWLDEIKDLKFDQIGYDTEFAVPTSLKENPVEKWKKWWNIEVTQTLSTDFLWSLDKALDHANEIFSNVIIMWQASQGQTVLLRLYGKNLHGALTVGSAETLEELLPLFQVVQQKIGVSDNEPRLRDQMVQELQLKDERSVAIFSKDQGSSGSSGDEDSSMRTSVGASVSAGGVRRTL